MSGSGSDRSYLSIGEVLGLLLDEFPDVTISKIRFLESQGLIDPERTASGYRKFYTSDIDRLRTILREQRENHLPLRVIRDRLDQSEIEPHEAHPPAAPDDSGAMVHPWRERYVDDRAARSTARADLEIADDDDTGGIILDDPTGTISPFADQVQTARHPAARATVGTPAVGDVPNPGPAAPGPGATATVTDIAASRRAAVEPVLDAGEADQAVTRAELCARCGLTSAQVDDLRGFGVIGGQGSGSHSTFSPLDVTVAQAAAVLLASGFEARHLRTWRQAAEREAGVLEQRLLPQLRQRNPQARAEARDELSMLVEAGGALHRALVAALLDGYLQS